MSTDSNKPPPFGGLKKNLLILLVFSLLVAFPFFEPVEGEVKIEFSDIEKEPEETPLILQENSLLNLCSPLAPEREGPKKKWVIITGYSSTKDQCDEDPWTTASGSPVGKGIVATNFLPFETKIKIPEIYGEEIFVVKDRMNPRARDHIDIWFPSRWQALNFGAQRTYIEILEG